MKIDIKRVKISVAVPSPYTEKIRREVCDSGAGVIGNYTYCSSMYKTVGTFMPNEDANPFIGTNNKLEYVEEDMLEFICNIKDAKKIYNLIKNIHPYEESVINIVPLIDEEDL